MKQEGKKEMVAKQQKDYKEKVFQFIFLFSALISVVSVIAIIAFVFSKGLKPFFGENAYSFLDFITGLKWDPGAENYGIFYMIVGSVLATLGAIVLGVPIGLLTAVFIAEIAPKKIVAIIRPAIELLAGIPSVIYGAFGLGVIVQLIKKVSPTGQGESLLAVICVLTIMILPTIITLSESSLRAVPKSYREASYGLGASKIQTIFKTVVPAARSGILSATVLGIGRAMGETMAVMMIAGNNIGGLPNSIWSKIRPLTSNISMEMSYASGRHQDMLFATGVILFLFILVINTVLIKITSKMGNANSKK
ncbi:phosphate ABC transporter permease subunit PstC [Anaerocolumna sp.]|uniref:phosphate ABC transporter permease subunit PstC n=1 Tax=Anaerocolumna sp. TaxID=2041569 RepID=UPI002F3EF8C4